MEFLSFSPGRRPALLPSVPMFLSIHHPLRTRPTNRTDGAQGHLRRRIRPERSMQLAAAAPCASVEILPSMVADVIIVRLFALWLVCLLEGPLPPLRKG